MKIEVDLNTQSEELITEIFNRYEEEEKIPKVLEGRTIIHMYPVKDTIDEHDEAQGFVDSLFFNYNIYNVITGKAYKQKGFKDEICFDVPCRIRAFKDLSTMIIIDSTVSISNTQSVMVYRAK